MGGSGRLSAILVTGASSQVGGALIEELAHRDAQTRAMVRTEEQATAFAARDVEAVVAHFERPETLPGALEGVDRAFLMLRDDPKQPTMEAAFIEAAIQAGVERIVKLSANGARPDNPVALMRWHAQGERTLEDSGLEHTVLRPQLYMQNFLRFASSIAAEGRFTAPMCERRFAFVDVRDVARVAAATLLEAGHAESSYIVSGPGVLSYDDAAETIGAAIGKEVVYEPAGPHAFRDDLVAELGVPRWRADDLAFIASAYGEGEGELVTDVVGRVGGSEPRSFAEFVKDHADHFAAGLSNHI